MLCRLRFSCRGNVGPIRKLYVRSNDQVARKSQESEEDFRDSKDRQSFRFDKIVERICSYKNNENSYNKILKLLDNMDKREITPTENSLTDIINLLISTKNYSEIDNILERFEEAYNIEPTEQTYKSLLKVHLSKHPKLSQEIQKTQSLGLILEKLTGIKINEEKTDFAKLLLKIDDKIKDYEIYNDLKQSGSLTMIFNIIIKQEIKANNFETVEKLYKKIEKLELSYNRTTYIELLRLKFFKNCNPDEIEKIIEKFYKMDILNEYLYSYLIVSYIRSSKYDEIIPKIIELKENYSILPTSKSFKIILSELAKKDEIQMIYHIIDYMKRNENVHLTSSCYTILLSQFIKNKNYFQVEKFYNDLIKSENIIKLPAHLNMITAVYRSQSKYDEIFKIFTEAKDKIIMDDIYLNFLLEIFVNRPGCLFFELESILNYSLKYNILIHSELLPLLIKKFCRKDNIHFLLNYFLYFSKFPSFSPSILSFEYFFIFLYFHDYSNDDFIQLSKIMADKKFNLTHSKLIIGVLLSREKFYDKILKFIQSNPSISVSSCVSCIVLFDTNVTGFFKQRKHAFDILLQFDDKPTYNLFNFMIQYATSENLLDDALEIAKKCISYDHLHLSSSAVSKLIKTAFLLPNPNDNIKKVNQDIHFDLNQSYIIKELLCGYCNINELRKLKKILDLSFQNKIPVDFSTIENCISYLISVDPSVAMNYLEKFAQVDRNSESTHFFSLFVSLIEGICNEENYLLIGQYLELFIRLKMVPSIKVLKIITDFYFSTNRKTEFNNLSTFVLKNFNIHWDEKSKQFYIIKHKGNNANNKKQRMMNKE